MSSDVLLFAIKEVLKMAKNKHLSLSDRYDIEKYLNQGFNFSEIGRLMNKYDRTIAFEVKNISKELRKIVLIILNIFLVKD